MRATSALADSAALIVLALLCTPVEAQIDRGAYQLSNLEEVMAAYRLQVAPEDLAHADAHLVKPELKYRLRLRTTGQIREVSPGMVFVLQALSFRYAYLSEFLKAYTHEVEVVHEDKSRWLPLQHRLLVPFLAERPSGGMVDAYVVLVGNRGDELLLLLTAYEAR